MKEFTSMYELNEKHSGKIFVVAFRAGIRSSHTGVRFMLQPNAATPQHKSCAHHSLVSKRDIIHRGDNLQSCFRAIVAVPATACDLPRILRVQRVHVIEGDSSTLGSNAHVLARALKERLGFFGRWSHVSERN